MRNFYSFILNKERLIAAVVLVGLVVFATACNRVSNLMGAGDEVSIAQSTMTAEPTVEPRATEGETADADAVTEHVTDSSTAESETGAVNVKAATAGGDQTAVPASAPVATTVATRGEAPVEIEPTEDAPTATQLPVPPTATPAVGALTIWHSWAQSDGDALEAILQDFVSEHPEVAFETLFVAQDDLLQSYAQAVSEGGGPDVILAPNWWLHDLTTLGVVAPISDDLFADAVAAVWPAALDNLRIGSELYGAPTTYETVALYYNKSLVPTNTLPASLNDLERLAGERPENGIGIYANPFHVAWGFPAFGVELFDETGHAVIDQYEGATEFLQWLVRINDLEGSYVDSDYGMLLQRFKQGEYAFFIDGPWALQDLSSTLGDDLGVAIIPAGPAGESQPWLYADAIYVNPNLHTNQMDLAALFVKYITNARSGVHLAEKAGRLPANRSTDLTEDVLLSGFAGQAYNSEGMKHSSEMDAFWRYGGDMILKARAGSADLQTIVTETAALINEATGK